MTECTFNWRMLKVRAMRWCGGGGSKARSVGRRSQAMHAMRWSKVQLVP